MLQLHTWTRAWNRDPRPLEMLRKLQAEGKIRVIGISTPEHDQNSVIDLMRGGWLDAVQVIYNIFEQEPAAELLPAAGRRASGVIVRVAFDEGMLTGKCTRTRRSPRATSAAATSPATGWSARSPRRKGRKEIGAPASRCPRPRSSSRWPTPR